VAAHPHHVASLEAVCCVLLLAWLLLLLLLLRRWVLLSVPLLQVLVRRFATTRWRLCMAAAVGVLRCLQHAWCQRTRLVACLKSSAPARHATANVPHTPQHVTSHMTCVQRV
jgi:hypothetical protein